MGNRFKFYDKNFKRILEEKELNWKNISYALDFENKSIEIKKTGGNVFVSFDLIKELNKLIKGDDKK